MKTKTCHPAAIQGTTPTPFLKTERSAWVDTICSLLDEFAVAYSRREDSVRVRVGGDAPDDDYGHRMAKTTFLDVADEVNARLKAAKKANKPDLDLPQAEVDAHVLAVYRRVLETSHVRA